MNEVNIFSFLNKISCKKIRGKFICITFFGKIILLSFLNIKLRLRNINIFEYKAPMIRNRFTLQSYILNEIINYLMAINVIILLGIIKAPKCD